MEEVANHPAPSADKLMNGFRLKGYQVLPNQNLIVPPNGESVHVEPRVMLVLVELARRPGQTISQDEFLNSVWGDTVVTPQVLSRAINLLRNALGDSSREPRFIRTVSRRGYELIADVGPLEAEAATPRRRLWQIGAVCLIVFGLVLAALLGWQRTTAPTKVAVIPFTAPESPLLPTGGVGLADYLISALTDTTDLSIVARRDSFAIESTTANVESIGERLGADYLVGGALAVSGDRLLLTLTLTETASEADVWSEIIVGQPEALGALQEAALTALSNAMVDRLGIAPLRPAPAPDRLEDDAYRKYLEAQHQWNLRGEARINRAIGLLREAIELRPDFAEAHLALAQSLAIRPFYNNDSIGEAFAEARAALAKVPTLTDELTSDVNALRGSMFMEEHRWAESEQHLLQALEEDPDNTLAHYWYSHLLSMFGDSQAALTHVERAAALDPYSAVINNRLASTYLWVNDAPGAARQFRVASDLGYLDTTQIAPHIIHAVRNQRWEEIRQLLLWSGNSPDWVNAFVSGVAEPAARATATPIIETAMAQGRIPRQFWFGIWVLFEDADRAFRAFNAGEKSIDIEFLWWRECDFVRADPRFPELIAALQLPDHVRAAATPL